MMDHESCHHLLGSLSEFVDGSLEEHLCNEIERHLSDCDNCRVVIDSLKKTSRVLFVDEDVPGGTSAYMFQEVLERQGGYYWLDSAPKTLTGKAHRPAYGSDGDYWSKPNVETIFDSIYEMMREVDPGEFPEIL